MVYLEIEKKITRKLKNILNKFQGLLDGAQSNKSHNNLTL